MPTTNIQHSPFVYNPAATAAPPVTDFTAALLDSAAALERRLAENECVIQALKRELRLARLDLADAQQWVRRLRRSHRGKSHAATTRLFTEILDALTARQRAASERAKAPAESART